MQPGSGIGIDSETSFPLASCIIYTPLSLSELYIENFPSNLERKRVREYDLVNHVATIFCLMLIVLKRFGFSVTIPDIVAIFMQVHRK